MTACMMRGMPRTRGLGRRLTWMLVCVLLLCLGCVSARAQSISVEVTSAADIVSALSGANAGDTVTFVLQDSFNCDSSLDNREKIVIPAGVTAVFTNAPGKAVTVTREYVLDISAIPFSPMVTVEGALVIRENTTGGGSLTFAGNDKYFMGEPMFTVTAGTMTVESGTIRDVRGYAGCAIYATADAGVHISGGTFTNCVSQNNGFGGVICAYGELTISGGMFTENDAGMGSVVYYAGNDTTQFIMTGGTMSNNGKSAYFGGAVIVDKGRARITGGTFTSNTSTAFGGAIYVSKGATLFMARVLAFDNFSSLYGGGIYNCGTGGGDYRRFCGMTLYENHSFGDPKGNDCADDFFSETKEDAMQLVYVSDYTLNNALRPWYLDEKNMRYQPGDDPAPSAYYQDTSARFAIKSGATEEDFNASSALAWVTLTGNSADCGGAIANNGVLDIGYDTALTVRKIVSGEETDTRFTFDVTLTGTSGQPFTGSLYCEQDGEEHLLVFDDTGKASLELGGGEQAVLLEVPLGFSYTIVERETEGFNLLASTGASGPIENEETLAVFTNERVVPTIDFTVNKRWEGDDKGAIELTLYADGVKLSPQPVCIREGNVYTYEKLPQYDADGHEIVYFAKEGYFSGYVTIYKNIAPWSKKTQAIYDGGTIVNRAVTSISVRKVWTGVEGETPAITLTLYKNGEVYHRDQPEPDRNGLYTYTNLPLTVNGEPAEYYVVETPMSGFVTAYENVTAYANITTCAYNGGVITNRKVPQTGEDDLTRICQIVAIASLTLLLLMGVSAMRRKRRDEHG